MIEERWISSRLSELAGGREPWSVRVLEEVPSTMDVAKGLVREFPAIPGIAIASRQTAGRGTHGRSWLEPESGLYATFAFPTAATALALQGLSLATGASIRETLSGFGADVALKWPNDLLTRDGRKLGGILIELSGNPPGHVLIGVGVNIAGAPLAEAASLGDLGVTVEIGEVTARLGAALLTAFRRFEISGFRAFKERWLEGSIHSGRSLSVDLGGEVLTGAFAGVADDGALLLDPGCGCRRIYSGQILKEPIL